MGPRSFYLALFSWGQWLKLYLMYAFLTFKTEFLSMNYWSHKWLDSYPKALVSLCVAAFSILWENANVKFRISLTMDSWHFQEEGIIASLMLSSHGTSEAVPTQSLSLEMALLTEMGSVRLWVRLGETHRGFHSERAIGEMHGILISLCTRQQRGHLAVRRPTCHQIIIMSRLLENPILFPT